MKIAVTGANGFIGQRLVTRLSADGHDVAALERKTGSYSLAEGAPNLPPVDLLIHLAHQFGPTRTALDCDPNVLGASRIFSQQKSARKIFVSSMSAHAEALSRYGQSKWKIESFLNPARDCIVRPGFVIGAGGVCQHLKLQLEWLPLHPMFYGGKKRTIQIIAIDDLIAALGNAVNSERTGFFNVAYPEPYTLTELYRLVLGRKLRPLPLPGDPILYLLKAFERAGLSLPLNSENLLGLKAMITYETARDMVFKSLPEAVEGIPEWKM